jgi:hypothetical protein
MIWWTAHIRMPKGIKHACKVMWPIDHINTDMFCRNSQGKHACWMM